ncbi:Na(+)/H(+) antiporter NhaA 1 [Pigmentiphaga litoralis]|uniref:Na+/H+ antiporter NhaA n=1 Tax=Pigmentiphaga litoralis TaxID=516702 RepID=UPI00167B7CDE|nr:Na+/H+ antiporter NhaA [Pigmentiphaga litoralis]GGX23707.1 Na(+)/H(+) antiporter NhaA 1 [Pigmentiphaga litoralis]
MPDRTPYSLARPTLFLRSLLAHSAAGGVILMVTAALAILVANSPLVDLYQSTLASYVGGLSVLHWINDGLMAVFFLLVGLEIKREVLEGELSSWPRRILPGSAALGGMVGPALIYLAFNLGPTGHPSGWAIPAATDIAFALGVLSLLGPRVPVSLRVFLMALAIIDDLGAVVIIALFYTTSLDALALGGAGLVTLALIAMNRAGVNRLLPYIALGALLWFLVLKSGIHATLAGVVLAFTVPLRTLSKPDSGSPLLTMEHGIQPWVTFLIVPLFGFANAGVSFAGMSLSALIEPVPLGIALGLFVGKQLGVFFTCAAVIKLGLATLPAQATWKQMYGLAALCGIGFTMSLFIGLLAFPDSPLLQDQLKLGVLAGSLASTLLAVLLLRSQRPVG